jgi:hypothetical protein
MRVLTNLIALHETTKCSNQKSGRVGLSKRLYVRTYEINRIGRGYDDIRRVDVGTELVLKSYLARKVYINEKNLRNKFFFEQEDYDKEVEFTKGLWKIFCIEVFGTYMPELPVPETYAELDKLFRNDAVYLDFSLYKTVKEAVIHNQIKNSKHFQTIKDFDLFCSLPGIPGWTAQQHGAMLADGRVEAPQRLMQVALGMFKLEHIGCPEPYQYFWKERANAAMKKAIVVLQKSYIVKFRNATMYDLPVLPERFEPIKTFVWNKKRA